ncbi:HS12B-like protein [Mya arenaria]|uniref:HS12B-like protein n=1 Tax=Mya arenaria TaxID=6604 RepID=A0ABY7DSB9_MYAAR|nr:HS12B-like protein [Mya arenaria]
MQAEKTSMAGIFFPSSSSSMNRRFSVWRVVSATMSLNEDYLLVAAIDFGTAFSGYAFSTRDDFTKDPLKIQSNVWGAGNLMSQKTSTCVLFDGNKKFHSFGFDAEDNYSGLALDNKHHGYYFFKQFKMMLFDKMTLKRRFMLEDAMGKKMPAMDAGIPDHCLLIALEPEAASLCCRHLPMNTFQGISKGGTVDITVHEVQDNNSLRELFKANGGNWGGTYIEKAFRNMLAEIVGNDVMDNFQATNMMDFIDLLREFEVKKRNFNSTMSQKITFKVPIALNVDFKAKHGKDIKDHIATKSQYKENVSWVSDKLRLASETAKESKKFIDDDGDVLCSDMFDKHVETGQPVEYGKSQVAESYCPTSKAATRMTFEVFASSERDPTFVTEPSCKKLGSLQVDIAGSGTNRSVTVEMSFSGTELHVQAHETRTPDRRTTAKFDFLG